LGLVAYRDHKDDYIVNDFGGFTPDVDKVVTNLGGLTASGGADGPEAVAAALDRAVYKMKWRTDAVKIAVLIADAPPHGIGEKGDDYPSGDPDGKDPLKLAREMAKRGINLLVVACEPTLSNEYTYAHDFYMALARITHGSMVPLVNVDVMAPFLAGFALEHIGIDKLADEFKALVIARAKAGYSQSQIAAEVHAILKARGDALIRPVTKDIYEESADAEKAISIWTKAGSLEEGKKKNCFASQEPASS